MVGPAYEGSPLLVGEFVPRVLNLCKATTKRQQVSSIPPTTRARGKRQLGELLFAFYQEIVHLNADSAGSISACIAHEVYLFFLFLIKRVSSPTTMSYITCLSKYNLAYGVPRL